MFVSVRIYVQFSVCARCVFVCASVYFEKKKKKKKKKGGVCSSSYQYFWKIKRSSSGPMVDEESGS